MRFYEFTAAAADDDDRVLYSSAVKYSSRVNVRSVNVAVCLRRRRTRRLPMLVHREREIRGPPASLSPHPWRYHTALQPVKLSSAAENTGAAARAGPPADIFLVLPTSRPSVFTFEPPKPKSRTRLAAISLFFPEARLVLVHAVFSSRRRGSMIDEPAR